MLNEPTDHPEILKIELSNALQEALFAKEKAAKFLNQCARLETEIHRIQAENTFREKSSNAAASLIAEQKKMIADRDLELNELRSFQGVYLEKLDQLTNQVQSLTQEKTELEKNTGALTEQVHLFKILESRLREQISARKAEMETIQERLFRSDRENQASRISFENNSKLIARAKSALEEVKIREQRVNLLHANLSDQQAQLNHFSEEILNELILSSNFSPLGDLLKVTEFEINKLELELRTTPTSDGSRASMERAMAQLLEQRNFLKSVVQASHSIWETKIERLKAFRSEIQNANLPPLPPITGKSLTE